MTDLTLNLGPAGVSKAYDIPAKDWEIANKRVSVVLEPSKDPELTAKLQALPNYTDLVSVSQQWKDTTFEALVNFAQQLGNFANTDVQSYLQVLGMIVEKLKNGDQSMQPVLDNTVKGFTTDTLSFTSQANDLIPELKKFDDQMTKSSLPGGDSDPAWQAFKLQAGLAFDDLFGRFQTITDDLNNLQTQADKKLAKDLPIVVSLVDLPLAKQNWQTVADNANGFAANAPQQTKYLNGDW